MCSLPLQPLDRVFCFMEPTLKRTFNKREKQALYIVADGKCEICGCELEPGWHADHVQPYSKGGETDVINAQALCAKCNMKKGNRSMMKLFDWQEDAKRKIQNEPDKDVTIQAPMGSGKTLLGKHLGAEAIRAGQADMLVILTPRTSIRDQWKDKEDEIIHKLKMKSATTTQIVEKRIASEVNAITMNYQQLTASQDYLRSYFKDKRVYLIADEMHYLTEGKRFFESLNIVFPVTVKRVGMSATPMRSDGKPLPFLKEDGTPYFVYSLAAAVDDGVLRYPKAIFHDGIMKWFSESEEIEAGFNDDLSEQERRRRLRTAIDERLPYVRGFFERLDQHMQERQVNAGIFKCKCVVFCRSIESAMELSYVFKQITSAPIEVITSDDNEAHEKLEQWAKSDTATYAFAVGMMHVGFNDPHITDVAVLTTITYTGWLYQMFGRALRNPKTDKGIPYVDDAFMFAPKDERFVQFYNEWQEELYNFVIEAEEREIAEREIGEFNYEPLYAEIGDIMYLPIETIEKKETLVSEIRKIVIDGGSDEEILEIIKKYRNDISIEKPPEEAFADRTAKIEGWLTNELRKIVYRSILIHRVNPTKEEGRQYFRGATSALSKRVGCKGYIVGASEDELKAMQYEMENGFRESLKTTDPREWKHAGII